MRASIATMPAAALQVLVVVVAETVWVRRGVVLVEAVRIVAHDTAAS